MERIVNFFNKNKINYIISPYIQEKNRYKNNIVKFEEISIIDSETIIKLIEVFPDFDIIELCIQYLFDFLKDIKINIVKKLFGTSLKSVYYSDNNKIFDNQNNIYKEILKKRNFKFKKYKSVFNDVSFLKSFVHLSINRFLGVDREMEKLVLKRLKRKLMLYYYEKNERN